jgi:hypothetical protein
MKILTQEQQRELKNLALSIGATEAILYKIISGESGFNPLAKNPNSSARGLLQWIDSTARGLGYRDSLDLVTKNPTIVQQLRVAKEHFKKGMPFANDYEVALFNFLPAYRKLPPETKLIDLPNGAKYAKANPQLKTLGDYYNYVNKRKIPHTIKGLSVLPSLLLLFGSLVVLGLINK